LAIIKSLICCTEPMQGVELAAKEKPVRLENESTEVQAMLTHHKNE
jgi:hypothetical protein